MENASQNISKTMPNTSPNLQIPCKIPSPNYGKDEQEQLGKHFLLISSPPDVQHVTQKRPHVRRPLYSRSRTRVAEGSLEASGNVKMEHV